jgi:ribosomal protein S18 acetylase RimI-like enzyme
MTIISRSYKHKKDFNSVMAFLRDNFTRTGNMENWLPPRFENSAREMGEGSHLWFNKINEESSSDIVAMANPEDKNKYFIQVDPDHAYIENDIFEWIINTSREASSEPYTLSIVTLDGNRSREKVLEEMGFNRGRVYGILMTRKMEDPIPNFSLPERYTIRPVTEDDFDEIASAIRVIFGHGEWFTGKILEQNSKATYYHSDLDLVTTDTDGRIVSFCTFRYDLPSGITELEPMGTLPEYRGMGIAKAMVCEGLKRLRKYEPSLLYVGSADNPAAKRLYQVTGFKVVALYFYWEKNID